MPSRKKTAVAAPPKTPPLDGCQVALSGTFPISQARVKTSLTQLGATVALSVTANTTHLITTQTDFDKPTAKVAKAQEHGIPTVSYQWLEDCTSSDSRVSENIYAFGAAAAAAAPSPSPPPAPKNKRKRSASPVETTTSSDVKPAAKKANVNGTADIKDEATEEEPKKQVAEGQVAKSRNVQIPLDEGCPLNSYAVHIDDQDLIWDASLNQTNAGNNNNKFYRIQLLHNGTGDYKTWTRWGRVGDRGQTKILGSGTLDDAINKFSGKFKEKSGLKWEKRGEEPIRGKYAFIEKSYNPDSDEEDEEDGAGPGEKEKQDWVPPACTLDLPVRTLMELIFNQQYFAATMTDLNYDSNKMPLGKLSKASISRGFQALKDLSALFDDNSLAKANYDVPLEVAIEDLSNRYYSLIPHAFGRNRPPVIQDYALLKKEIELLESLGDMKDAELIMKVDRAKAEKVHPLDKQYNGLGMQEMTPLDHGTTEFKLLKEYLMETRGHTHNAKYVVEDIFRIERQGEHDRFNKSVFGGLKGDRRMLWHGSRATNFGGILSQGLRIAPPEAPVSGYMFGKGVYLADMSSKSANYCCSYISGNTALLLLCEAELGNPLQELTNASYTAGDDAKAKGMYSTWGKGHTAPQGWKDASCVHPDLAGVMMPDTSSTPGNTNVSGAYLQYNEYIVYDVAQVRLRYLFRVKM